MNLALFGSGEFTEAVDDIDKYLIAKYKPKNIAIIPTAAGQESDVAKWTDMAKVHYAKFDLEVIPVSVLNKDHANDQNFVDLLADAEWIFFSGGNPGYLLETLHGSKIWEEIMKRVDDGALLAGSSAGAMIMGKFILTAPSFKAMFTGTGTVWKDAFGLVDYTILPHFDHFKKYQGLISRIIGTSPSKVHSSWMGIDEDTAIIFEDGERIVRGRGGVEIHDGEDIQHVTDTTSPV